MTTVTVTPPRPAEVNLLQLMTAWADRDNAVIPYDSVYRPDETPEENDRQGAIQMVSSQDTAIAVALAELDYEVETAIEVQAVDAGSPAEGRLQVRDIVEEVDGTPITSAEQIGKAVASAEEGESVTFLVKRGDLRRRVSVTPTPVDGEQRVGISIGLGYDLPVDVKINIPENISGPSAGLMLTGDLRHAHAGVADRRRGGGRDRRDPADGSVGPIGGIDRRSPAPPATAPGCSWSRPTTAPTPPTSTPARCAWCWPRRCTAPGWPSRPGRGRRRRPADVRRPRAP